MNKQTVKSVLIILLDFIFLVLFVFFIPSFLRSTVGFDVIEYENWFGDIENPIRCRFGAGCCELTIILARLIGFIIVQCKILKENSKIQLIISIVLHIIIGILGLIFYFRYADGPSFIYMLQTLFNING